MKKTYFISYMFVTKTEEGTTNTVYGHCVVTIKKITIKNFDNLNAFLMNNYCNGNVPVILSIYKF